MKFLFFIALVFISGTSAQDNIRGVLVSRSAAPLAVVTGCTIVDYGIRCNSCTTGLICSSLFQLGTVTCKSPTSYCDHVTNECTETKPAGCEVSFTCSQVNRRLYRKNWPGHITYMYCKKDCGFGYKNRNFKLRMI